MKRQFFTFLLLLTPLHGFSVWMPNRAVDFSPFEESSGEGFMTGFWGAAEFSHYIVQNDEDHFWDAKFLASTSVFHKGNFIFDMEGGLELISSSNSTIAFQPRAIFLYEGFMANYRPDNHQLLRFGFTHRCKHDVDNTLMTITQSVFYWRTLAYSSITASYSYLNFGYSYNDRAQFSLDLTVRNYFFVYEFDQIWDDSYGDVDFSISNLVNTLELSAEIGFYETEKIKIYAIPYFYVDYYKKAGESAVMTDFTVESGIEFKGREAGICLFGRYEKYFDTLIAPWRRSGQYVVAGIKVK